MHAWTCFYIWAGCNNIPGVLPAKWATKGKEMSQVNFLFVDLSPVLVLFCFFFKFHKLFSFNYSGMVGSTGVNGTDDSDELMRKLRALWNYQKKRVAIFLGVCWYLFRYLQMWRWLILLRISTDARIHFVMMVSPLISWDVYVISVQTNTCIWTWDM